MIKKHVPHAILGVLWFAAIASIAIEVAADCSSPTEASDLTIASPNFPALGFSVVSQPSAACLGKRGNNFRTRIRVKMIFKTQCAALFHVHSWRANGISRCKPALNQIDNYLQHCGANSIGATRAHSRLRPIA